MLADVIRALTMHSVESNDLELNKHNPCRVMLSAFLISLSKPSLRIAAVHEGVPPEQLLFYTWK